MTANKKEFLDFLTDWKSTKEIKAHFNLSNSEFYHIKKWCEKGKFIETYIGSGIEEGKTNRTYLYRAIK